MQNQQFNIMRLIELEQTMISGIDDKLASQSENAISKDLNKTIKKLGRSEDILRALAIYLACYAIP